MSKTCVTAGADLPAASESLFTPPDKSSATPAWIQLRDEIVRMISDGTLAYGQKMPTMRNLAKALDVSVSVVNQTYRYLRVTGYLESRQGSGVRVRVRTDTMDESQFPEVTRLVTTFIDGCEALGMGPLQIRETVEFALGSREFARESGLETRSEYSARVYGQDVPQDAVKNQDR